MTLVSLTHTQTPHQLIKMQAVSVILCLSLVLASVHAAPSDYYGFIGDWDYSSSIEDWDLSPLVEGVRLPRATCDLLSVNIMGNSVGHAACAAHCLALRRGFRGGRCRDGVCHCRK